MNYTIGNIRKPFFIAVIFKMALLGSFSSVFAAQANYSFGLEYEYTDNAVLAEMDEEDDLRRSMLAAFSLQENNSRLNADINSMIELKDYRDNSYNDESLRYLSSEITWIIRPSSIMWIIDDYFSQISRDPLLPETPDNLIDTNVFSTGPDFQIRLSPVSYLQLEGRYSNYKFDDTRTDSIRRSLLVAWTYIASSSLNISISSEYQNAEYIEQANFDYNQNNIFIRINSEQSRLIYQLDLGVTRITRSSNESFDGFLGRLLWRNQFRSQSYFQLSASAQYTDSAQNLLTQSDQGNSQQINLLGEQVSGDIYYDREIDVSYHIGLSTSTYEIRAIYREEDYETLQQDRITKGLRLSYGYTYSTNVAFDSYCQYRNYDNLDIDRLDKEYVGGIGVNYQIARNYAARLEYGLTSFNSNNAASEFLENRILFSFYYGINPRSYR